jgi:hypothetical protein
MAAECSRPLMCLKLSDPALPHKYLGGKSCVSASFQSARSGIPALALGRRIIFSPSMCALFSALPVQRRKKGLQPAACRRGVGGRGLQRVADGREPPMQPHSRLGRQVGGRQPPLRRQQPCRQRAAAVVLPGIGHLHTPSALPPRCSCRRTAASMLTPQCSASVLKPQCSPVSAASGSPRKVLLAGTMWPEPGRADGMTRVPHDRQCPYGTATSGLTSLPLRRACRATLQKSVTGQKASARGTAAPVR